MCYLSKFSYYSKINKYNSIHGYKLIDPLFILGCGHSGTSILLSILANSNIFYSINYESYIFYKNELARSKLLRLWVHNAYSENKWCILEKTPSHCLVLPKILKVFKNPKIIAITRDGRDVALSIKNRTGDFEYGMNRWINDNNNIRKYYHLKNIYILKYEDFVSDPLCVINSISRFINLNLNPNILNNTKFPKKDFYKSNANNSEHENKRNAQINQDLHNYSGIWKNGLTKQEKDRFHNETSAIDLMEFFNYNL